MPRVSVANNGQGLRSFQNLDKQPVTLKPGDTRTIEMHAHHVMVLERAAGKPDSTIEITMSAAERKDYEAELKTMRKTNTKAKVSSRTGSRVLDARALPPTERRPAVDQRFLTDPMTVRPERTADPARKDQDGPGETEPDTVTEPQVETEVETETNKPPAPTKAERKAEERVPLKK